MLPITSTPISLSSSKRNNRAAGLRRHGNLHLRPEQKSRVCILGTGIILSLVCLIMGLKFLYEGCDTREPLGELLRKTTRVLVDNNVTQFWLDKGSLLGVIRENELIPWEYDVDISLMEEDCKRMDSFKNAFQEQNLFAYNRSDWIEQKRTRIIIPDDSWFPSYQSPYLTVPCYRIYDSNKKYFVDIYWKNVIPKEEAKKNTKKYLLPKGYNMDEDLLCDAEGLIPEMHCCGGCDRVSTIFPLRQFSFLGEEYFNVPHKPQATLETQFGKSWTVKMIKGYKKVTCVHITHPTSTKLAIIILIAAIAYKLSTWKGSRGGWKRLRNMD